MSQLADLLSVKIQRLMISEEKKQELLASLEGMDELKLKELDALINRMDGEAIQALDQKSERATTLSAKLKKIKLQMPKKPVDNTAFANQLKQLEQIFEDPKSLMKFLALCDDAFLVQYEKVLLLGSRDDPELQKGIKKEIAELRLQKAAFDKSVRNEKESLIAERIESLQDQEQKLDAIIQEAQALLMKKPKSGA